MNKDIPSWLGCPVCQESLSQQGELLYCSHDDLSFPVQDGILRLLPEEQREAADAYAAEYRAQREKQGWRSLTAEEMAALPTIPPGGWDKIYWPVRHKSFEALSLWFKQNSDGWDRPLRIVDMGAGVGWLAGRLAMEIAEPVEAAPAETAVTEPVELEVTEPVEVIALDLSCDDAFGLGAAGRLNQELDLGLTLVQGDIEASPIQQKSVDLLIYNASLHYAVDLAVCLANGAALLRPGGVLVIMDSPISTGPVTAIAGPPPGAGTEVEAKEDKGESGRSGRQLPNEEVVRALTEAGLTYVSTSIRRGLRWQIRQLRMRLFGMAIFDLPIIIARLD